MFDLPPRILAKISPEPNSGCWLWAGAKTGSKGSYGLTRGFNQEKIGAHKFVYEFYNGPVPVGLELDHKCRVRFCVNPEHLEPVTHQENCLRGNFGRLGWRLKPTCSEGHAKELGSPCKICAARRAREARAKAILLRPPKAQPTQCVNGHEWNTINIG